MERVFLLSGPRPKTADADSEGQTIRPTFMRLRDLAINLETFFFLFFAPQLSSGWDQPMGSLVLPVKNLLAEPQLVTDQWFHLDGASPDSQVLLRAELKVSQGCSSSV